MGRDLPRPLLLLFIVIIIVIDHGVLRLRSSAVDHLRASLSCAIQLDYSGEWINSRGRLSP